MSVFFHVATYVVFNKQRRRDGVLLYGSFADLSVWRRS